MARLSTCRGACLLGFALLAAVGTVLAAEDTGIIRLTSVTLTDHDGTGYDVPNTDMWTYFSQSTGGDSNSPSTSITVDWLNVWPDSQLRACFTRFSEQSYSDNGGTWVYPLSTGTTGDFDNGTPAITVAYKGLATNFEDLGNGEGVVQFASGGGTETVCISTDIAGGLTTENGLTQNDNCGDTSGTNVLDKFNVNGGSPALSWSVSNTGGCTGTCTAATMLGSYSSLSMTVQAVDFSGSIQFSDPLVIKEEHATIRNSLMATYENEAIFIFDVTRTCPSILKDDANWADVFDNNYPAMEVLADWEVGYTINGMNIDCDALGSNFDCSGSGSAEIKLEYAPLTLQGGDTDWTTATTGFSTVSYSSGFTVAFAQSQCGVANRKRFRLSLFTNSATVDHAHLGKLELTQSSPAPASGADSCQDVLGSRIALTYHTLDNDFDEYKPADSTSVTGDFRTFTTAISYTPSTGKYDLQIGGRAVTEGQYTADSFQRYLTVVGVGASGYQPDGASNKYLFNNLADGTTQFPCINIPADYRTTWLAAANTETAVHDTLWSGTIYAPSSRLLAMHDNDYTISQIASFATDGEFDMYPIRPSSTVIADATVKEIDGESGVYKVMYQFNAGISEIEKCVAPSGDADAESPILQKSNSGSELDDAINVQYTWPMFHQHLTYRGDRVNEELYALNGNDVLHTVTYTVVVNTISNAMVSLMADEIEVVARFRQAKYEDCDSCVGHDTGNVNLPAAHACGGTEALKQLQLTLEIEIAEAETNDNGDLGIVDSASKFTANSASQCYYDSDFEWLGATYGASNADGDSEEVVVRGGKNWNRFVVNYGTACVNVYSTTAVETVENTFTSCTVTSPSGTPNTFSVDVVLQRVRSTGQGSNTGTWLDTYTESYSSANTKDDGTLTVNVNLAFEAPVASLAKHQVAHSWDLDFGLTMDATDGTTCTSGNPCAPLEGSSLNGLSYHQKMTFMARLSPTSMDVGADVTLHIREFVVAELNTLSPWYSCALSEDGSGTACLGDGTAVGGTGIETDAPTSAFDFGNLGSHPLNYNLRKDLWFVWMQTATGSGGAGLSAVDAATYNPIKNTWTAAYNYEAVQLTEGSNGATIDSSSVLCRASDANKPSDRWADHHAWACAASTECELDVTFKPSSGNLKVFDAITVDFSALSVEAELAAKITTVSYDCGSTRRRLAASASASASAPVSSMSASFATNAHVDIPQRRLAAASASTKSTAVANHNHVQARSLAIMQAPTSASKSGLRAKAARALSDSATITGTTLANGDSILLFSLGSQNPGADSSSSSNTLWIILACVGAGLMLLAVVVVLVVRRKSSHKYTAVGMGKDYGRSQTNINVGSSGAPTALA